VNCLASYIGWSLFRLNPNDTNIQMTTLRFDGNTTDERGITHWDKNDVRRRHLVQDFTRDRGPFLPIHPTGARAREPGP
jgi:hypothetical protein